MEQNGKDDLKTQFVTREGAYRLITLSEYSRPNRVGYQSNQNNPQVRVSLLPAKYSTDSKKVISAGSFLNTNNITPSNTVTSKIIQNQSTITSPAAGTAIVNGIAEQSHHQQQKQQTQQQEDEHQESQPEPQKPPQSTPHQQQDQQAQQCFSDKICFNFGKELYVYTYRGVKKNVDLCKPIDKKLYKGTSPSCHDFNATTSVSDCSPLLVGFTTGQIQLVQPGKRETGRLFNEERLIDKTKVTCLKWLPKSPNLFLASHSSGHIYLYNEELPCSPTVPNYQNFKTGDGFTIYTCKSKSTRNPLYKWTFNTENCSINEFGFSPCGTMLAIVSQDGFLRVFHYDTMEIVGLARSYFGGFLCVCWSPDSKYIVVGGEDDLVTVWSVSERRVVARGQGHRSWVSVVAFDPYTSYSHCDSSDLSDDENSINPDVCKPVQINPCNDKIDDTNIINKPIRTMSSTRRTNLTTEKIGTSYRLGSVGQDTQLCLWDITEDILRQSYEKRHRRGSHELQNDFTTHTLNEPIKIVKGQNDSIDSNSNSKANSIHLKHTAATSTIDCAESDSNACQTSATSDNAKFLNLNNFSKPNSKVKNVMEKCMNTTRNEQTSNILCNERHSTKGNSGKSADSGLNPFNTLTQRLSNFNFVTDKKTSSGNSHTHKKAFIFAKTSANHGTFSMSTDNPVGYNNRFVNNESEMESSSKNSKNVISTYDPMKLIGSASCPRFDECPLLEPLVCKKIAHERLTALIFREDCFLTACQDGFIYTWARPGFASIPQHNMSSPTGASSGTVV